MSEEGEISSDEEGQLSSPAIAATSLAPPISYWNQPKISTSQNLSFWPANAFFRPPVAPKSGPGSLVNRPAVAAANKVASSGPGPKQKTRKQKKSGGVGVVPSNQKNISGNGTGPKSRNFKMLQFLCNPNFLADFQERLSERIEYLNDWLIKIEYPLNKDHQKDESHHQETLEELPPASESMDLTVDKAPESVPKYKKLVIQLDESDDSSIASDDLLSSSDDDKNVSKWKKNFKISRMPRRVKASTLIESLYKEEPKPQLSYSERKAKLESEFELHQKSLSSESDKMQQLLAHAQSLQSSLIETDKISCENRKKVQELREQLKEAELSYSKTESSKRAIIIQIAGSKETIRKQQDKITEIVSSITSTREELEAVNAKMTSVAPTSKPENVDPNPMGEETIGNIPSSIPDKPKSEKLAELEKHLNQVRKELLNNRLALLEKSMAKQHMKLAQADKQRKRLGLSPIRVPTTRINVINNLGKLFGNVDSMSEQQMSMAIEEVSETLIEDWLALNVPSTSTVSFMYFLESLNLYLSADDFMLPSDLAKRLISSKIGNYEELVKLAHVQKSTVLGNLDVKSRNTSSHWESAIEKLKTFHLHPRFWKSFSAERLNLYFQNRNIDPGVIVCRFELTKKGSCRDKNCQFQHLHTLKVALNDDEIIKDMMSYLFDPLILTLHGKEYIENKVKEKLHTFESNAMSLQKFGTTIADTFASLLETAGLGDLFSLTSMSDNRFSTTTTTKIPPTSFVSSSGKGNNLETEESQETDGMDWMEFESFENQGITSIQERRESELKGLEAPLFLELLQEAFGRYGNNGGQASRYFIKLSEEKAFEEKLLGKEVDENFWVNYALSCLPSLSFDSLPFTDSKIDKSLSVLRRGLQMFPLSEGLHLFYLQLMRYRSSRFDAISISKKTLESLPSCPLIWWHLYYLQESWRDRLAVLTDMVKIFGSDTGYDSKVLFDVLLVGVQCLALAGKQDQAKFSLLHTLICLDENVPLVHFFRDKADEDHENILVALNEGSVTLREEVLMAFGVEGTLLLLQLYRHLVVVDDFPDECHYPFPYSFMFRRDIFVIQWKSLVGSENEQGVETIHSVLAQFSFNIIKFLLGLHEDMKSEPSVAVLIRCHLNHVMAYQGDKEITLVLNEIEKSMLSPSSHEKSLNYLLVKMDILRESGLDFNPCFREISSTFPYSPIGYHKYAKFLLESDSDNFGEIYKCLFYTLSLAFGKRENEDEEQQNGAAGNGPGDRQLSETQIHFNMQRLFGFPVPHSAPVHEIKTEAKKNGFGSNDLFALLHYVGFCMLGNVLRDANSPLKMDYSVLYQMIQDGASHMACSKFSQIGRLIWIREIFELSANLPIFNIDWDTRKLVLNQLLYHDSMARMQLAYGYSKGTEPPAILRLMSPHSYEIVNSLLIAFETCQPPDLRAIYSELSIREDFQKNITFQLRHFSNLIRHKAWKEASMVLLNAIKHNPELTSLWALWLVFRQDIIKESPSDLSQSFMLLCKYLQPYWWELNERYLEFCTENGLETDWINEKINKYFQV